MKDFIDLTGASGAAYRFRRLPEGSFHAPIAGNYAVVAETADGWRVLRVGVSGDLSRIPAAQAKGDGPSHVYTRLNVARAVREAEHADLAAIHPADPL